MKPTENAALVDALPAVDRDPGAADAARGIYLGAEGLRKSYRGRTVVNDVSLGLRQGEVVGLLGPNGAGKTTIFYMIVGLERPDRGSVTLDGAPITGLPMYLRARRGISYLPQEASIFRKLTVEENIMAILETLPLRRRERRERLEALLEELAIAHVRRTRGHALSGGERRRTEIARCLVLEPQFILLDEPFAGIDPLAVIDIQEIISQLKQRGIGVLITDHNVRETLAITDRAYIINEGRIFRSGTPSALTEDEEVRRIYLGENFRM
jgi:lipopolysaccharide export system ATP-binding protein